MKRLILILAVVGGVAYAASTTEVLVGTSATLVASRSGHKSVLITNNGPNDIWCSLGTSTGCTVNKGQVVKAGGGSLSVDDPAAIYCIASVAQLTGAATTVSVTP